jgi:hypothetical protein
VVVDNESVIGISLRISHGATVDTRVGWISVVAPSVDYNGSPEVRGLHTRLVEPHKVNWNHVKDWLWTCAQYHKSTCGTCESTASQLQGFNVIDCTTRKIISAPEGCEFVALSYVWGSSKEATISDKYQLPADAPAVVEDAVLCARYIGLQYLWIDRYCIDEADHNTKQSMIQHMDQIYSDASVTIVNAAGDDSSCGLPGVSDVPRHPQTVTTIHGGTLAVIPSLKDNVDCGTWSTRGW